MGWALLTLLLAIPVLGLAQRAVARPPRRARRAKGFIIEGSAAYPTLRRMP